MQLSLDAIGLKHGTDKASHGHDYLNFYDKFFSGVRKDKIKILEIGIYGGASLKVWHEFFPSAEIIGVDINPSSRRFKQDRVQIEIADQSNVEEMTRLAVAHGPFDIVIEDGSHYWEHQITSLRCLFPFLKDGGLYVAEDLHSNYGIEKEDYKGVASSSCVEYLKAWADLCCGDHRINIAEIEDAFLRTYGRAVSHISFSRRCCIIQKKYPRHERTINVGSPLIKEADSEHVSLTAHVAGLGDVVGSDGYVNLPGDLHQIQGLAFDCARKLLYRVLDCEDTWSHWASNGDFVGSRGCSISLKGIELGFSPEGSGDAAMQFACRFGAHSPLILCRDGEACIAPEGGTLCGIQVIIHGKSLTTQAIGSS